MAEEKKGHYERRGDVDEWVWDEAEPEKPEPKPAAKKAAAKK